MSRIDYEGILDCHQRDHYMVHDCNHYPLPNPALRPATLDAGILAGSFATIALLVGLLIFGRKNLRVDRKQWLFLLAFGFILSLYNSLWTISVDLNGAAISTVLAYSSPAFTALIAWKVFDEKLTWLKFGAGCAEFCWLHFGCRGVQRQFMEYKTCRDHYGVTFGTGFCDLQLDGKISSQSGDQFLGQLVHHFCCCNILLFFLQCFPA